MRAVRSGSPGRRMYSASSPGPRPMWYCRSPDGIAILRSDGFSTRWSAFGKTSSSLRWLLRWRETRPRIVPPSHERQAEWIVRGSRSAERGAAGCRRRGSGGPANAASRRGDPGGQEAPRCGAVEAASRRPMRPRSGEDGPDAGSPQRAEPRHRLEAGESRAVRGDLGRARRPRRGPGPSQRDVPSWHPPAPPRRDR